MTPFDIKRDMAAILFSKLGQNYYQANFPTFCNIFCANLMNLAAIFQVLQHLNACKIVHSQTFEDQDFPWAVLHSEALAPVISEI